LFYNWFEIRKWYKIFQKSYPVQVCIFAKYDNDLLDTNFVLSEIFFNDELKNDIYFIAFRNIEYIPFGICHFQICLTGSPLSSRNR